jgi:tetratricopeptide (TPR) repeat protein
MVEAEFLYKKGTTLLETDPERAVAYLTQSLALKPDSPPAVYNRAVAFASLGRDAETLSELKHLERLNPVLASHLHLKLKASAAPYTEIGNKEFQAGNYASALSKYESALAYDPEYANAWVGKGLALHSLGETAEARKCYDRAIELERSNFYAWINRADLSHEMNELEQALSDYSKAIELAPNDPNAYVGRSAVFSELGQPSNASRDKLRADELSDIGQ